MSASIMQLTLIATRLAMAGIFIYASLDKIAQPAAFAKDVYNYQILPDALINLTAIVLPWLELVLGLCLLAGIWLPGAVLIVNGLLVVFMAAFVFNLARGLDVTCGCFGAGGLGPSMPAGAYLLRDIAFFALAAFLCYAVFERQHRKCPTRAPGQHIDNEKDEKVAQAVSISMPERRRLWIESNPGLRRSAWQLPALVVFSAVVAVATNALRADRLPLVGDFSAAARMTTATGERMDISLEEAQKLFFARGAVFVDARPIEDYANGRIQGARSLPWQDVDLNFMTVTADIDLSTPIVTYCDGETCELSHDLALFLRDAGFANTRVLVNGWAVWQQAGLPVESGPPSAPR